MPGFLIEYNRENGAVSIKQFDSLIEATKARLLRDREVSNSPIEVVAISAVDEDSVRRSHSRYFMREASPAA